MPMTVATMTATMAASRAKLFTMFLSVAGVYGSGWDRGGISTPVPFVISS